MTTARAVATRTCANVSIAGSHMPSTPIEANMASVVTALRTPLTTKAIAVSPSSVVNQGASTRNLLQRLEALHEDEVPDGLGDREDERRRVLDVVESALDPCEQPRLCAVRLREDGRDSECLGERNRADDHSDDRHGDDAQAPPSRSREVTPCRVGAVGGGLGRPVECHGHDHDRGAGQDGHAPDSSTGRS